MQPWYARGTQDKTLMVEAAAYFPVYGRLPGLEMVEASWDTDRDKGRREIPGYAPRQSSGMGERWPDFARRYGDWGCAMVLHLVRQRTGPTLREGYTYHLAHRCHSILAQRAHARSR